MTGIELSLLYRVLDALEEQENALLVWGDTGGFFNLDELFGVIGQVLPDEEAEAVLDAMLDGGMLIQVPHLDGPPVWRTRMGETVHLLRNLRQWMFNKSLDESKTLVSDYRFIRRPRSYPERKAEPKSLIADWKTRLKLSDRACDIMHQMLASDFRLAGFQERSTERILQYWQTHRVQCDTASGTIVCAGTGSGKTLSFYLPALTRLAEEICANPERKVRILAIYPRKELLKDQVAETFSQCRKLDDYMQTVAGRKIRIGAFYGDTPKMAAWSKKDINGRPGLPFGLMKCQHPLATNPKKTCGGELIWRREDIYANREVLTCTKCQHQLDQREILITRHTQQQRGNAPDILFTTTEMLNLQMNSNWTNHLFGVGEGNGPTLVLLDEVHTYSGTTGAQTALLLRRWMQRTDCLPHFVGLSATLADAQHFFAKLVGAPDENVALIKPKTEEMVEEGAEYLLALRGDPVSETALLSTTIQTSMLMARMLDSKAGKSKGTWGKKTFIFTDTLDGNNRLYHDLNDAEGWKTSPQPPRIYRSPLAVLRNPYSSPDDTAPNRSERRKTELGQNWKAAMEIGHDLSENKVVSRTSSQDAGVDALADIVVATSSLEVGYNDPQVGAVLQHKAPNDVASYLQRKGRAGRPRGMRPWMLVVLSEFGRDRVAFQRYEGLMSPEIKRQGLPLRNQHVQKMQAAMATLDWLSKVGEFKDLWGMLKKPNRTRENFAPLSKMIEDVLGGGRRLNELSRYLENALHLPDSDIQTILWSPPRSIMFEFLPSILRSIRTHWAMNGVAWAGLRSVEQDGEDEQSRSSSPAPEYIPQNLFSELNLPELDIRLRRGYDDEEKWETLSFWQGLREFAPGRLSKRYAIKSSKSTDWLVPKNYVPVAGEGLQSIDFPVHEAFGEGVQIEYEVEHLGGMIKVVKPSQVMTTRADVRQLADKSNAQLQWSLSLINPGIATPDEVPKGAWKSTLRDITFYNHQHMTPLELIRFSTGSLASLRFKNKDRAHVAFSWVHGDENVGVGSRQWVDAMRLRFTLSNDRVQSLLHQEAIQRGMRPVYFQHLVKQLPEFEFDSFKADWAIECFMALLAETFATGKHSSTEAALQSMASAKGMERLAAIPASLFQPDTDNDAESEQLLQISLRELLDRPEIQQSLLNCAQALFKPLAEIDGFIEWAQQVLADTLAAGVQQTLSTLLPDVDDRAVVTDSFWMKDPVKGSEWLEIWLCEMESGGSGILIRLQQKWAEDPVTFLNVLVRNLSASDYEQIDYDLYMVLQLLKSDDALCQAMAAVREAGNMDARCKANKNLHMQLSQHGLRLSHSFTTVLYSRILRAGSSEVTDVQLYQLLTDWISLEASSGIEFTLNTVAHALAVKTLGEDNDASVVFNAQCRNQNLLWPRGYTIRQAELSFYNMFCSRRVMTERLLAGALFSEHIDQIPLDHTEWLTHLHGALCKGGRAELILPREQLNRLHEAIVTVQIAPVDYLGLLLYPRLGEVRREQDKLILRIELAEVTQ